MYLYCRIRCHRVTLQVVSPVQGKIYVNSSRHVTIVADNLFGVEVILDNVDANDDWSEYEGKQVSLLCFITL